MGSISTPNSGKITEPAVLYAIAQMANPCFACTPKYKAVAPLLTYIFSMPVS